MMPARSVTTIVEEKRSRKTTLSRERTCMLDYSSDIVKHAGSHLTTFDTSLLKRRTRYRNNSNTFSTIQELREDRMLRSKVVDMSVSVDSMKLARVQEVYKTIDLGDKKKVDYVPIMIYPHVNLATLVSRYPKKR